MELIKNNELCGLYQTHKKQILWIFVAIHFSFHHREPVASRQKHFKIKYTCWSFWTNSESNIILKITRYLQIGSFCFQSGFLNQLCFIRETETTLVVLHNHTGVLSYSLWRWVELKYAKVYSSHQTPYVYSWRYKFASPWQMKQNSLECQMLVKHCLYAPTQFWEEVWSANISENTCARAPWVCRVFNVRGCSHSMERMC